MPSPLHVLFLVLVFVPSITKAQVANLTIDYYQKTCPDFSKIVREIVTAKLNQFPGTASGMLRLFFHDCFLEGCDASVLISSNANNRAEREDGPNMSLPEAAFETVASIKTALETSCPGVVSCADILAQSTRDLVTMVGGPTYEIKLGRKDGLESNAQKVRQNLPLARETLAEMLAKFEKNGFTLNELVALSGGHTIGICHCRTFSQRIFGPHVDPELDPKFLAELKAKCQNYETDKNKMTFLDSTPKIFDNVYFKNLIRGLGVLATDQVLFKDMSTRPFVELYANNQTAFFEDFARAMEKLSMVGVKGEQNGEVRRRCDSLNNV